MFTIMQLETLIERGTNCLLREISKYIPSKNVELYKQGKLSLYKVGICEGLTTVIDIELQKIDERLCCLSSDSLTKFKKDIEREYNRPEVQVIPKKKRK